jgi:hypothetical protein
MRTLKALVCVAALATGLATAMAQSNVYSLNVVGYYNVTVPASGLFCVANQLNTTNNYLQALIPVAPGGSTFYKYNGGYNGTSYDDLSGAWDSSSFTMNVGEAGMMLNGDTANPWVITFVGEVLQGQLANDIPALNSIRASMVPQQGTITGDLGVPAAGGDTVFIYNGGYAGNSFDDLSGTWDSADPGGPIVKVGQGFFYKRDVANPSTAWVRNFTVQ